jgi:hypothetical protein
LRPTSASPDLDNTNGTYIGTLRVRECFLTAACVIRLGDSEVRFVAYKRRTPDMTAKAGLFGEQR